MAQHGSTQADLPETGDQSIVSEALSGKRRLDIRQLLVLSRRFDVSADAFIAWSR